MPAMPATLLAALLLLMLYTPPLAAAQALRYLASRTSRRGASRRASDVSRYLPE